MHMHRQTYAIRDTILSLLAASNLALAACDVRSVDAVDRTSRAVIEALAGADALSLDTLVLSRTRTSPSYRTLLEVAASRLQGAAADSIVFIDAEFEQASGRPSTAHVRYEVGGPRGRIGIELWMELDRSRWMAETVLLRD